MFLQFDPMTYIALVALAEGAGFVLTVAVGLWTRDPERRETALAIIRAIRGSGKDDGPG